MFANQVTRNATRLRCRLSLRTATSSAEVRVRFAPSPTGPLHLGSLRTALFNYLYARAHGGAFIMRIEDTDRQRTVPDCEQQFERILDDYGLTRDEGPSEGGSYSPYRQSERSSLYQDVAEQLIEEGAAYRCFCTPERLDILRRQAALSRSNARYDGRCRSVDAAESRTRRHEPHTVRLRFDRRSDSFLDLCHGRVDSSVDEGDFVILKSDKMPTYHLANVVDDRAMHISHVIRGQEWLASTPKHIRLYEALGAHPPVWLHLPLIMKEGGKRKLSKRDEGAFVDYYRLEKGYLRSALLNFLIRNGTGIKNFDHKRLYSLDDMIRDFDVSRISTRSLQMDTFSLSSYGRMSILRASYDDLFSEMRAFLQRNIADVEPHLLNDDYLKRALVFLLHNEEDFSHLAQLLKPAKGKDRFSFLFTKPHGAIEPLAEYGRQGTRRILDHILDMPVADFTIHGLRQAAVDVGVPYTKLFQLIRRVVINNEQGPPIQELLDFFGVDECRERVAAQVRWLDECVAESSG